MNLISNLFSRATRLLLILPIGTAFAGAAPEAAEHAGHGESFDIVAQDSFLSFFRKLFGTDFMPHGHCYWWRPEIVWLHVLSDTLIGLAYFSIPLMLVFFIRKRKDLPFYGIFLLFAAFILWCGTTHFLNVLTLWYPVYRLDGVVKAITAIISLITAFVLYPLIPQALTLKSPKELEEKNQELQKAYQKLKELEKLKDDFFANVSHELKTPLTLIMAPVESLLSEEFGPIPPEQIPAIRSVQNNAIRLLQLISGLLDFSKLEAGKVEAKREPTNIVTLTKSLYSDFRSMFDRKHIKPMLTIHTTHEVVSIDRYLYERILFNLLSNAVKFTDAGGQVDVSLEWKENTLTLSVRDTGIGIDQGEIGQLFQKFRQVEGSSTRRFQGTGLGLSLVKEFSHLLGGTVRVESEVGKGSVFVVQCLAPLADKEPASHDLSQSQWVEAATTEGLRLQAAQVAPSEKGHSKILVAEDNQELADYLTLLLSHLGEVRRAADGEEALNQVKTWMPDMVLSDVMMPKMDGFSLCRAIKSDTSIASIPVVLLTAVTYRDALIKGWESGADEYLFKPFHPRELVTRVRSVLRVVQERRLREADQSRRQELENFSHIASHDLKEPLRTVTTFSQMLQKHYRGSLDAEGDKYIGFIVESAKRMQQLLDDLIAYSLVTTETAKWTVVPTQEVVQNVLENLRASIQESGAQVEVGELPEVAGNEMQLLRLFQNLIGNAIKYRGAETLYIRIEAKPIEGEWLFSIQDNGIGFEKQYAEQIFVIFKRLHDRRRYQGTGMGLAICKKVVELHRGRIWADSEVGKGSTFYFTLKNRDTKFRLDSDVLPPLPNEPY